MQRNIKNTFSDTLDQRVVGKQIFYNRMRATGKGFVVNIFNQLDIRVDKEFFFKKFALKLYLDVQNLTNFDYKTGDVLVSTGRVLNPEAPRGEQRYEMKEISLTEGTILPSIGITVEF